MKTGKLTNETLGRVVLNHIDQVRDDILVRPAVGEDCAAIEFGDLACVITTDPITGSNSNLGNLAVNVCVNDIASSGAVPAGLMLTVLCPEDTKTEAIEAILQDANRAASEIGVEIIGGHTELTSAVNRIIVSATAIGKVEKDKLIQTKGAVPGDYLYMTKVAGLEGTAIIASDKRQALLEVLSNKELSTAQEFFEQVSVLKEGLIGADIGVSAMHDATEGGVLGAIHELCTAGNVGCRLKSEKIKIHPVTQKICDHFHIDPLKLIASGSMIMAVNPERAGDLERAFKEAEVSFSKVGTITKEKEMRLYFGDPSIEEVFDVIPAPEADELYKVI
ncbi:AIR synthase family protein [Fusibacter tunisiensis]|uniref:Hydrogenase expression/formation protein HypE n=1 Tax=Fusibacter tunisiensis TaxID=1008308 RepID=A0ABS2MSF3_9FIRM|nr:AIR synthase family protein [Fusibacter tunisiensis]MBM7562324.1 hydrogenase expression/formation protein HypE [Fusibacter tunisiensis]